jgi:hypothetical protein
VVRRCIVVECSGGAAGLVRPAVSGKDNPMKVRQNHVLSRSVYMQ